jgi:hypothetical protein
MTSSSTRWHERGSPRWVFHELAGGVALADTTGMTKIALTSTLLALLCGPALADSPTYRIELVFAATQAHHTLYVTDHGCGELLQKSAQRDSLLKICASTTDDKRVRLAVERRVRDNADEQSSQVTLIATSGTTFEVLDARLTVKVQ